MKNNYLIKILILLMITQIGYAQSSISGNVSDINGGLPGASVTVKGSTTGTATDMNGDFTIEAQKNDILVFSFLGLKTTEIAVDNQNRIDVVLEESMEMLDELVITAQGISKEKKALGYAVTKIEGEEIENKAESDVGRTLQGKIAGVQISASSGSTGNSPNIQVRSALSLNQGNSPLLVVNDIPFSGDLIDINPNDIESINVLKGLNASVLYGSRGRNGVILIQTKSNNTKMGEKKVKVSISQTEYTNQVSNLPEFQNKYGQGNDGVFVGGNIGSWGPAFSSLDNVPHPYANQGSIFPQFEGTEVPYQAAPNNVKKFFRTGFGKITALNIATSQENTAFNLSAGYIQEDGIIGTNDLKKFNIAIGGTAKLSDRFTIKSSLAYSTKKRNSQSGSTIFDLLLFLPRNIDLHELPYSNPVDNSSAYYRSSQNPLWFINNMRRVDDLVKINGAFNTNYKINNNLNVNYRIGFTSTTDDDFDYQNRGGLSNNIGFLELDYDKTVVVDQSIILNGAYQLSPKIKMDGQLGINSNYRKTKSNSSEHTDQIVYGFLRPSNFINQTAAASRNTTNLAGAFGQFEFSYDKYFYLTLSGRNDWGSTVEQENRSIFYPGVSFSFIPTSAFDMKSKWINFLKIRGAYATSSGYPDANLTRPSLNINRQDFVLNDGTNVITNSLPSILPNPNLKPELHREMELGIEGTFLNKRLTLETSVFKRISENQIVERDLDNSTGYNKTFTNIGRVDTKGIEIDLGIDIIKKRNFSWNSTNIFTAYRTEVVELEEDLLELSTRRYAIEGEPYGVLFSDFALRDSQGNLLIDPNNGEVIVSDDIGLPDRIIGDPNPQWTWTNINTFKYKNFQISAQLEYTKGGKTYSGLVEDLMERGVTRDTENREGSFVIPGVYGDPTTGLPILDETGNTIPNTVQMSANELVFNNYYNADDLSTFDTSVFRIREIALSYTLKKNVLKNIPVNKISFNLSGRNIFYKAPGFPKYMNIDPELSTRNGDTTYPTTKRYSLGIKVTF